MLLLREQEMPKTLLVQTWHWLHTSDNDLPSDGVEADHLCRQGGPFLSFEKLLVRVAISQIESCVSNSLKS